MLKAGFSFILLVTSSFMQGGRADLHRFELWRGDSLVTTWGELRVTDLHAPPAFECGPCCSFAYV